MNQYSEPSIVGHGRQQSGEPEPAVIPTGPELNNLVGTLWEDIAPEYYTQPITILAISSAERSLVKSGLTTIAHLLEWAIDDFAKPYPGIGAKKVKAIREGLLALRDKKVPKLIEVPKVLRTLEPAVSAIPTTGLHMGTRSHHLVSAGYPTLSDLADWYEEGCPKLANFGETSVREAKEILESVAKATNKLGSICWETFSQDSGIKILPQSSSDCFTKSFLSTIPDVIKGIIGSAADEVEADIIRDRLTKPTEDQLTLEDLGSRHGLTPERVRQKQRDLLAEISNGLMEGLYEKRKFRFRPEYSQIWKEAEHAFHGSEEIGAASFITTLCETWEVKTGDLLPHLPFIFAVLTNTHSIPASFRCYLRYPFLTRSRHSEIFTKKPVEELHIGKHLETLQEIGVETLGELIQMLCNFPEDFSNRVFSELFQRLEDYLQAIDLSEAFSWEGYYRHYGRTILPVAQPNTPSEFLAMLKPVILQTVQEGQFCSYSEEILQHRSFPRKADRLTSQAIADIVGCHGPTISRNELVMNQRLRKLVVEKNFSASTVIFQGDFLNYWHELAELYEEDQTVSTFKFKVTLAWELAPGSLDGTINLIWSILTNHPPGKNRNWYVGKRKLRKKPKTLNENFSPPVIVLRRKRTVH